MKHCRIVVLCWLLAMGVSGRALAQYNLEEMGVEAGPGISMLLGASGNAVGPGANANFFFSHYACGKGYGFHVTAGAAALFPGTTASNSLLPIPADGAARFQFAGLDLGFMGKLRLHEYHRPREWALFLGPKLMVPFVARASTDAGAGPLSDVATSVGRFWGGAQLSMQFRRPASKKKSWFIHPGVEYYFLPAFRSTVAGDVRPLYVFLHFGFAFWDQRG